jgi:hypothetical protein
VTPPTAPERCPTCDKPKGDQARADAHPLAKQWSAWIAMVPGQQRPLRWRDVADAQAADQPGMCIESQCQPVDWRARAIAAEAERSEIVSLVSPSSDQSLPDAVRELCEHVEDLRDDAQQWRNAVAGSQEPGDPVIRAIAALLACTYLDKLPTPPDDDFRRELAVAARIAHDKRRTAAAQWAKVAPLIEELRRVSINDGDDPQELEALRNELIAATEVTP